MHTGLAMFSDWEIVATLVLLLAILGAKLAPDFVQTLDRSRFGGLPGWLVAFSVFLLVFTGLIAANGGRF